MINRSSHYVVKTLILTVLALVAFAANSVLCRLALGDKTIDASSFTVIRLLSGALVLLVIVKSKSNKKGMTARGSWSAGFMLFLYAIAFSYAYITLDTGTGALILFGSVQITMILLSVISGNRLHLTEWLGIAIAFSGFVYLVLPGVSTPPLTGFVLMTTAGIAWGIYTLKGRTSNAPLMDTTFNFLRTVPLVMIVAVITLGHAHYSVEGILLAVLSGAIASGIGYTIWYAALAGLTATQATVVQLSVPVIAALGGVVFVSEVITPRLALSGAMILGGISLVILGRYYFVQIKAGNKG
ncbi:MAG: DMT family transporter [Gammaproteobacteria bacterium]|nr:DMT family transporter [Gammaproteobacteria bacterium]